MPRLVSVMTSLMLLLLVSSARADRTFSCANPPDKAALVAVRDNVAVGWTQDLNSRTCTFSIDGAKAASPRADLIRMGFNALRSGAPLIKELEQKQVDNLAYAMLASAPVSEIPSDFRALLFERATELSNCLRTFFAGGRPNFPPGNAAPLTVCRISAATTAEPAGPAEYVEIGVTWSGGRFVTRLNVPRNYPTLPMF